MEQTGTTMEYEMNKEVAKHLPNGTKKWACYVSKQSMMGGPASSPALNAALFGVGATIVTNKSKGVSARGNFSLEYDDALPLMYTSSNLQTNMSIRLPPIEELQPHLGAAKPYSTSAVYFALYGGHHKQISKTHDPLGQFNKREGQARGADAYAQLIYFYGEFGTLEENQLRDYYEARLIKTGTASTTAWKKYVDHATAMKLHITGHDAESMKELQAYKRLHGYLLRQLQDVFGTEAAKGVVVSPVMTDLVHKAVAVEVQHSASGQGKIVLSDSPVVEGQAHGEETSVISAIAPEVVSELLEGVVAVAFKSFEEKCVTPINTITTRPSDIAVRLIKLEEASEKQAKVDAANQRGLLGEGLGAEDLVVALQVIGIPADAWILLTDKCIEVAAIEKRKHALAIKMAPEEYLRVFTLAKVLARTKKGKDDKATATTTGQPRHFMSRRLSTPSSAPPFARM
jgi:hypothetical protein